jgi:hypothetical protein
VLSKLAALASLPLVPLFGDGHTRVQPILVDDLARLIVDIVETDQFAGDVLDCGGRDVVSMRELLDRLRRQQRGSACRFLPIPLALVLPPLRLLEALLGPALPMTVGQLATFRFDGLARPNPFCDARRESFASLDDVLAQAGPASTRELPGLERECRTFTRLLADAAATPLVVRKYVEAHRGRSTFDAAEGFERTLVNAAARGPTIARAADAYARLVMRRGALRKKLVLLLAILETSSDFHGAIDRPARSSRAGALARLAWAGLAGTLAAVGGLVTFGTLHLVARARAGRT